MSPQVCNTDLTGDGREEAVIIIQTGKGTGLDNFDIDVLGGDQPSICPLIQDNPLPYSQRLD
ncbi:hypothetical protein [Paenibacillus sp. DCT19]|uniref:hypothetical protein n=1 Tax=Paenibacillus sp. DCT19 TaxID=2211212 RepID=UPI000FE26AF4|nr:hypothetical protein [Paenibacillus sp. DCT19]